MQCPFYSIHNAVLLVLPFSFISLQNIFPVVSLENFTCFFFSESSSFLCGTWGSSVFNARLHYDLYMVEMFHMNRDVTPAPIFLYAFSSYSVFFLIECPVLCLWDDLSWALTSSESSHRTELSPFIDRLSNCALNSEVTF